MAYTVKDILNIALRSEEEAATYYSRLKDMTDNVFFKEKLEHLAGEEKKHKTIILALMRRDGVNAEIDEERAVSIELPSLVFDDNQPMSALVRAAMDAEMAARKFYAALKDSVFPKKEKAMLSYLSSMEASHYHMLEGELEAIEHFEDYDEFNAMMHVGP